MAVKRFFKLPEFSKAVFNAERCRRWSYVWRFFLPSPQGKRMLVSISGKFQMPNFGGAWQRREWHNASDMLALARTTDHCAGQFADGKRKNAKWQGADYLAIDIDDGATIESAAQFITAHKLAAFFISSRSHKKMKGDRPPCDRFHVYFPFSETLTAAAIYKKLANFVADKMSADKQATDLARIIAANASATLVFNSGDNARTIDRSETARNYSRPTPIVRASDFRPCGFTRTPLMARMWRYVDCFLSDNPITAGSRHSPLIALAGRLRTTFFDAAERDLLLALQYANIRANKKSTQKELTDIAKWIANKHNA